MVFVNMVRGPAVGRLVKALILDAPAGVAKVDHRFGAAPVHRQGGHPDPIRLLLLELAIELAADVGGFSAAHYAHRSPDLGPSGEALKVPDLSGGGAVSQALGRGGLKQGAGVRQQVAVLVLQNGEDIFAVVEK